MMMRVLAAAVLMSLTLGSAPAMAADADDAPGSCTARNPVLCPIADRPGLPRVLLIGDSVSMAYTFPVRNLLKDVANVHRVPRNGGSTVIGLGNLDEWLGSGKWDVIHVNFGLHDAKFTRFGSPAVDLDTYTRNVKVILDRLKATGAHVVWATTTPVPAHVEPATSHWADIDTYNAAATHVAKEAGVAIDDLYSVVKPREDELQRPANVHFNPSGSDVLAHAVADSIKAQLEAK